jgi:hypothetical protein
MALDADGNRHLCQIKKGLAQDVLASWTVAAHSVEFDGWRKLRLKANPFKFLILAKREEKKSTIKGHRKWKMLLNYCAVRDRFY